MDWKQLIFGKWGKLTKGRPEDMECAKLVEVIRQAILHDRFNGVFFHVKNEEIEKPKPQTVLIKKIIGTIPGAPDYVFMSMEGNLVIEMKSKDGKQNKKQQAVEAWCNAMNVKYYLCFSHTQALQILKRYKILLPP